MMKFVEATERKETITVDGYSTCKTLKGALKDMGRWIEKTYANGEGEALIDMVNDNEITTIKGGVNEYALDYEEVEGASRWNDETDDMEYANGNWYIMIRFVK